MTNREDPWAALGLSPGAGPEAIRQAYRRLVRENHPDRFRLSDPVRYRAAEERLKRLNAAYQALQQPPAAPSPTSPGGEPHRPRNRRLPVAVSVVALLWAGWHLSPLSVALILGALLWRARRRWPHPPRADRPQRSRP